jgi:hypothetical protein
VPGDMKVAVTGPGVRAGARPPFGRGLLSGPGVPGVLAGLRPSLVEGGGDPGAGEGGSEVWAAMVGIGAPWRGSDRAEPGG